jgi:hypothetical protein
MRFGAVIGVILGAIVASQAASAAEPDGTLAIRLARGVSLRNVALATTGSLQLGDRSRIVPRSVKVGTVSNAGTGQSLFGVSSNVGSNVLSVGKVALSNNARIAGSLLTVSAPSTQPGAGVTLGTTLGAQLTPVSRLAWLPPAPGSQAAYTLSPDQTGTLAAGSYGNVTIYSRAKVTLSAGVYEIDSLSIEPQATITFDNRNGPIIIYARSNAAGDSTAPTQQTSIPHDAEPDCFSPGIGGTLASDGTYSSLQYLTPDPATGVCAPTFCGALGQVIASPTEAQFNTRPPPGSTCAAFPSNTDGCPVDPTSLTTACTTDADCSTGSICAAQCVDSACTNIRHACGKPAKSCGGLPAQTDCDDLQLCPLDGAVGVSNPNKLAGQLSTTTAPNPTGLIPASAQDPLPPGYTAYDVLACNPTPDPAPVVQTDLSTKKADDGNKKWGVYFTPTSDFNITPVKRSDAIAELDVGAHVGIEAGAILFGKNVPVIGADVITDIGDCGILLKATAKLFNESVITWSPNVGQGFKLGANANGELATLSEGSTSCKAARDNAKAAIKTARQANVLARAAKQYYSQMGLTPELCKQIAAALPNRVKDANGDAYDCDDIGSIPAAGQRQILNSWKDEYDASTASYADFTTSLGTAHQTIQTSGTIDVFKSPHPFNLKVLDHDIPIGPVTLNVAVEGYGSFNIIGGVQFGLGFSGDFKGAGDIIGDAMKSELPKVGDIRAYGGPVITPDLVTGIQCFVGVGIPGVSIGLQGRVDLLDINLPTGIVAAAMRISTPDTRPLAGTDYAGTPLRGFTPTDYRWVTGFNWDSKLKLSELNGELDLALRVHFFFFHHTFKMKLFSWPGFSQDYTLISGASGGILNYANDYGKQADQVAYTPISPITDEPPKTASAGGPFPDCGIIVK